jgi:hypothetical protein
MAKKTRKWFDGGAACVTHYENSETLLFDWNGKPDGAARYIPHVRRYSRGGVEFQSLAALLRAVEAEHALKKHQEIA